jgi:putative phosphoesterase
MKIPERIRLANLPTSIEKLEKLAPVTAVAGNADPPELHERFGEKAIITLGGFRFGVVHGDGTKGKTLDRAAQNFEGDEPDCVIFGHSHIPFCEYIGGRLFFNPGSPTLKRRNAYYSFGIIETNTILNPILIYFDSAGEAAEFSMPSRYI